MSINTQFICTQPVVVVEDSDEDYDTFHIAATSAKLPNQIIRTTSGGGCLKLLQASLNGGLINRPGLVLMDLNTYGIDGRDALQIIKTDTHFKDLPVVVFSTSDNPKDLAFCYQAGANAYHVKPVRHDDHLNLLHNIFNYWLRSVALHGSRKEF